MKSPALLLLAVTSVAFAADPRGDNPDAKPSTPQEQLKMFHLPPGFEIQLVAAEPEIQKPLNLTFDAAGRLWVTGSEMYPWPAGTDAQGQAIPNFAKAYDDIAGAFGARGKAPAPSDKARDTVRVLSDFDETGRAKKITVFANGLNIPSGVQPLPRKPGAKGDTALVYSIPNIYRLEDTDGDGIADQRDVLYGTAGYIDTHGGMSSFLYWIDGWVYGTHGFRNHSEIRDKTGRLTVLDSGNTYRFRPDGSAFEIYTHGQTNPFGLTVDPLGNFYSADSHSKPVYMLLRGAFYEGIGKQHDGLGFAPRITDDDHGSTSIAGITYYADDKFPEEYRGNLFNGNPVTQRLNRAKLDWHGSTPKSTRLADFLTCDDPWFRPVNVKLGPDGALYIADFYNCIIGHYEFPLADPRRDHKHGRIWRVVYRGDKKDAPIPVLPDLAKFDAAGLVKELANPNLTVRTMATNELVDRVGHVALEPLRKIIKPDGQSRDPEKINTPDFVTPSWENAPPVQRAHALMALRRSAETLPEADYEAFSYARLRENEIGRTLSLKMTAEAHGKWVDSDFESVTSALFRDAPPSVKRAAWEVVAKMPHGLDVEQLVKALPIKETDDTELRYAARVGLREYFKLPDAMRDLREIKSLPEPAAEFISNVLLAVKTPEAAEFLLAHLDRTKLQAPRSGEFLRHAALHLAPERLHALAVLLTTEGRAPARPTSTGETPPAKDAPTEDQGRAGAHPSGLSVTQRLALADGFGQAMRQRGVKMPDEAISWTQRTMIDALATTDEALLKRALESVRETKLDAKYEPLDRIIKDPARTGPIRAAALEAVANLDLGPAALAGALADASSMTLRKRAAELLGQMTGNKNAQLTLLATLPTAPSELAVTIAAGLAKKDDTTEALLIAIEQGKAAPAVLRHTLVASAVEKRAQPLRDRAAALTKDLPAEDARLDKLIADRVAAFRTAQPNAAHGAQVYAQQCAVCHRLQNTGANLGPALDGVGARGVHRLTEDILDPNRNVDPIFRQTVIETTDGETLAGLNAREEGQLLALTDATGKPISVPKAKVKTQTLSKLSLMPAAFEQTLPPSDLNDLLAYLLGTTPK